MAFSGNILQKISQNHIITASCSNNNSRIVVITASIWFFILLFTMNLFLANVGRGVLGTKNKQIYEQIFYLPVDRSFIRNR